MRLSEILKHRYLQTPVAGVLLLLVLALSIIFFTDVKKIEIKHMGLTEVSWQDAMSGCTTLGENWSLPSINQLAAIYYRRSDIKWVDDTDYWSENAIAGFAFGMNTGRGIASFDRFEDTDHFLCIQ